MFSAIFCLVISTSIFESPATVDGKVGVVGSGGSITEFEVRKKYKFNIGGQ
jgi:hypothetical protein